MPLKNYGVLKGRPIEVRLGTSANAHYQVHLVDDQTEYRIAINVASALPPSDVEYIVIDDFRHPITEAVKGLPAGHTQLRPAPGTGALDYIRGNLFDRSLMKPLPYNVPGVDNDLNEKIDRIMQRAMGDEEAMVYAFGERWGPEEGQRDKFFGFTPGNGIHDIHMNQGNVGRFTRDDGVWQDGGLIVHFPTQDQWTAIFLKFQSQAWHTDDITGHRTVGFAPGYSVPAEFDISGLSLPQGAKTRNELPFEEEPQGLVRIVGALVNATQSPERERVTLLNTAAHSVSLDGWALVNFAKVRTALSGTIEAGGTAVVDIDRQGALSNQGGTITLLNAAGVKVDGVSYTRGQARHPGWTITF